MSYYIRAQAARLISSAKRCTMPGGGTSILTCGAGGLAAPMTCTSRRASASGRARSPYV